MRSSPTEIVAADRRAYYRSRALLWFQGPRTCCSLSSLKQSPASSATSLRSC